MPSDQPTAYVTIYQRRRTSKLNKLEPHLVN